MVLYETLLSVRRIPLILSFSLWRVWVLGSRPLTRAVSSDTIYISSLNIPHVKYNRNSFVSKVKTAKCYLNTQ